MHKKKHFGINSLNGGDEIVNGKGGKSDEQTKNAGSNLNQYKMD
jgi:hypothetical protein